ncbi:unnamed protein product [Pleuronectes platessa]|uniref:Uncharacterized protein n=1 Tax=Pleuronectes platessa TaxID=8262 RepID=A0A9N7UE94_PLEPL|nr:unnamed protein product [Pleuronectes platessa]
MALRAPLRRSISEHVKDSTNQAWDGFWRSVRERRLGGESRASDLHFVTAASLEETSAAQIDCDQNLIKCSSSQILSSLLSERSRLRIIVSSQLSTHRKSPTLFNGSAGEKGFPGRGKVQK